MKRSAPYLLAAAMTLVAWPGIAAAQEQFAPDEKQAIERIVRDYLVANPEVLVEAMDSLQAKQAAAAEAAQAKVLADAGDRLMSAPDGMVLGNPEGDVTIVEFFDYNCGFCRQALEDMNALIESDDGVRFVLKEFPILGPQSLEAARVSLAFRELAPEKYGEFHEALLSRRSVADGAAAMEIAADLGIDEEALEAELADPQIMRDLQDIQTLGAELQLSGTPSYVIGNEVIQSRVGVDRMKTVVANVRQCGSAQC